MLLQADPPSHVVSQIYSTHPPPTSHCTHCLESELGHPISHIYWQKCFILTNKLSLATTSQESGFKLVTRWYGCPANIKHCNQSLSDECWRCLSSTGTLLHIWWECPPVRQFWQKNIWSVLQTDGDISPNLTGSSSIYNPGTLKSVKKYALRHFIAAARTVIPVMPSFGD